MDHDVTLMAGYLLLINLAGFGRMGWDKRKARKGSWRTSELSLLAPGILGGIIGVLLGMKVFRHKTRKNSFRIPAVLILLLNVGYWYLLYRYYL